MKNTLLKVMAGVTYVAMVITNVLANALPLNNRSTGVISDSYPNLFAPAGVTFSIWGLIYLLLAFYVVYQFLKSTPEKELLFRNLNVLFIATSIANILWIFAWHYDFIGLSVIIMLTLLFLLIRIADILRKKKFTLFDNILVRTPFGVYFGWITVATIANITVFLVSIGWDGFGIEDYIWTSVILMIGALIGIQRTQKDKSISYGMVFIWAYLGILLKHVSESGFGSQYPIVINTVIACLVLLVFSVGYVLYHQYLCKKALQAN